MPGIHGPKLVRPHSLVDCSVTIAQRCWAGELEGPQERPMLRQPRIPEEGPGCNMWPLEVRLGLEWPSCMPLTLNNTASSLDPLPSACLTCLAVRMKEEVRPLCLLAPEIVTAHLAPIPRSPRHMAGWPPGGSIALDQSWADLLFVLASRLSARSGREAGEGPCRWQPLGHDRGRLGS